MYQLWRKYITSYQYVLLLLVLNNMPKFVFQTHLQDSGVSKDIFELPTCYQAAEKTWKMPLETHLGIWQEEYRGKSGKHETSIYTESSAFFSCAWEIVAYIVTKLCINIYWFIFFYNATLLKYIKHEIKQNKENVFLKE